MAIQLEDLGLVFTRAAKAHQALDQPGKQPDRLRTQKAPYLNVAPRESTPGRSKGASDFDVFLSYDSRDWNEVRRIDQQLRDRGIRPWIDNLHLQPGKLWDIEVTRTIEQIPAMAVFLGPHGGERLFRDRELARFLKRLKARELPLIPVILPSVQGEPEFPPFLESFRSVDFRQSDPDPLDQLIFGITGKNPFLDED